MVLHGKIAGKQKVNFYSTQRLFLTTGYSATDLNGDGNTDLLDVIYLDYGIANYVFSYHP
jgi:hypothetical protein